MDILNGLIEEIVDDLRTELMEDEEGGCYNDTLLTKKVTSAAREVFNIRKYPSTYSDDMILEDIKRYYSIIRNIAMYDYNSVGMEFEYSHQEKNISRNFTKRNMLMYGLYPITRPM